jgi:hypothetical protein
MDCRVKPGNDGAAAEIAFPWNAAQMKRRTNE